MLQNLQVVVGFDSVSNDRIQTLKSFNVGFDVSGELRLAVKVERPIFLHEFHNVLDFDALTVEEAIIEGAETMLECMLGRGGGFGEGRGGKGSSARGREELAREWEGEEGMGQG